MGPELETPVSITPRGEAYDNQDSVKIDAPADIIPVRDMDYYFDTVVFEVEDNLYKVPMMHFMTSTDFFVPLFAEFGARSLLAQWDDERPIKLEGVRKADFRALLKLMYPLPRFAPPTFSEDEKVSILRLSTRWKMLDIRDLAIQQLAFTTMSPIDKVCLARECGIFEWLSPAYVTLAQQTDEISTDDATRLGMDTVFKLCRAHDRVLKATSHPQYYFTSTDRFSVAIDKEFASELQLEKHDAVQRAVLARTLGVLEWLSAAYLELVERDAPLSDEEAETLGYKPAIRLCRARESRASRLNDFGRPQTSSVDVEMRVELSEARSCTAVERVLLARQCGVAEWLRSALIEVAKNGDVSGDEAANTLGLQTAIALYKVRGSTYAPLASGKGHVEYEKAVKEEFRSEMEEIKTFGRAYLRSGCEQEVEAVEAQDSRGTKSLGEVQEVEEAGEPAQVSSIEDKGEPWLALSPCQPVSVSSVAKKKKKKR